jgi:hypothetical protein
VSITTDAVRSNLDQGEVYSIMWQRLSMPGNMMVVFFTNKVDRHIITEMLLKVALSAVP